MDTALSISKVMPTTKAQRLTFVESFINDLHTGYHNPKDVHVMVKSILKVFGEIEKSSEYKNIIEQEIERYKTYETDEFKMEYCSTKTEYDYLACRDKYYNRLHGESIRIKSLIDARSKQLQTIKDKQEISDPDTGEIYEVSPPVKLQTMGVKTTFK